MFPHYSHTWMTNYSYCRDEAANQFNTWDEQNGLAHTRSVRSIVVTTGTALVLWILVATAVLVWA